MKFEEVKSLIVELLVKKYNILINEENNDILKLPLTGTELGLNGYELGLLVLEVEKRTHKKADLNYLEMYELAYIDNIARIYSS